MLNGARGGGCPVRHVSGHGSRVSRKTCHTRPRAFTMAELLLALVIVALISGVIATMIKATADGSRGNADGRRNLVRLQAIENEVQNYANKSTAILAAGNGYLVLWLGDGQDQYLSPNQAVNLSELVMFELNTTTHQLNLYTTSWPTGFSKANTISADTAYAASTDWYSACQTAKTTGYFNARLVANNVTAFNVTLDSATATQALIATCNVTINDGVVPRSGLIGAAIYYHTAPQ